MATPPPILLSLEEFHLDWLVTEMHEWKGIQEMIKQKTTKKRAIHHAWSSDIAFLPFYQSYTLVDDSIRAAFFGKAYDDAKTREELHGINFIHCCLAPKSFDKKKDLQTFFNNNNNNPSTIGYKPNSLILPDLLQTKIIII